jgi:glycine cleavage system aminomethyltransferase T
MSVLEQVTRKAGGVIDSRSGVAAHYGSPGGELAACVRTVGMADRSNLQKYEISGPADAVDEFLASELSATVTEASSAITRDGALCGRLGNRAVVLAEQSAASLTSPGGPSSLSIVDRSDSWAAIGLGGPATQQVLLNLGHLAEFAVPGTFASVTIAGAEVQLALPSSHLAVLIADAGSATDIWLAVLAAGQSARLSYVGGEAFRRYALWERTSQGRVAHASGL